MHTLVALNTALSEPLNLLLTVPGYGLVTAVSVLAETQGFHGLQSSRHSLRMQALRQPHINREQ